MTTQRRRKRIIACEVKLRQSENKLQSYERKRLEALNQLEKYQDQLQEELEELKFGSSPLRDSVIQLIQQSINLLSTMLESRTTIVKLSELEVYDNM